MARERVIVHKLPKYNTNRILVQQSQRVVVLKLPLDAELGLSRDDGRTRTNNL